MEKSINTVRGGVNPIKINGLVAEQISKDLATRLLDKTFTKRDMEITLYVSNAGANETADGSRGKPFKTLKACIDYAIKNIGSNSNLTIKFLTDYTNVEKINITSHKFRTFTIEGETNNIILGSMNVNQSYVVLSNLTFRQSALDVHCVYCGENANVRLENKINIEMLANATRQGIHAQHGKINIMPSVDLKFIGSGSPVTFIQVNMNGCIWCSANSVTIDNRMTEGSFIVCNGSSYFEFIPSTFTSPPRPNGRAFSVTRNSHLSFFGKGKPANMGNTENIDQSSSIS